ncbi:MAG: RNA methyltransferase [Syntrophobacterales bacterium]|jgi:hypothetical protein|nr:RNA methyltransferase [Syntrophobacterales bacterium]
MVVAWKPDCYLALLHHPVLNRQGQVVTTAVANMDVHDIARAARTYGIKGYYIVTPVAAQRDLVGKIIDHWRHGYGAAYNPSRKEAFALVRMGESLDDVLRDIEERTGSAPRLVATGAALNKKLVSCGELRKTLAGDQRPCLLIFGTGWGLAAEVISRTDSCLAPVRGGVGDYNHLSVRTAVAVVLDRLFGDRGD